MGPVLYYDQLILSRRWSAQKRRVDVRRRENLRSQLIWTLTLARIQTDIK
jgi:hypothetical protein